MRRLIVHMGDHKTGSTSIQYALAGDHVRTPETSLCYPIQLLQLNHNFLRKPIETKARGDDSPRLGWLGDRIRRADADVTILSAEVIEHVKAPDLAAAVYEDIWRDQDPRACTFVDYVRPQAARLLSSTVEQIKIGRLTGGPADFFEAAGQRFRYAGRLKQNKETLGDQFILRPMIRRELWRGSVVHDFFRIVFGEDGYTVETDRTDNASLSMEELMRLAVVQRGLQDLPIWERHAIGWHIADEMIANRVPDAIMTRPALPRDLAVEVHAAYADDAREVDQDFFDGRPVLRAELDRTIERSPENGMSYVPEDWLSASAIKEMVDVGQDYHARSTEQEQRPHLRFERLRRIRGDEVAAQIAIDIEERARLEAEKAAEAAAKEGGLVPGGQSD